MTKRVATFLYVFAGWTVFVWAVFIRNVAKDHTHGTGFKVVHITLAIISLAFAATTVWVVRRARVSPEGGGRDESAPVRDRRG